MLRDENVGLCARSLALLYTCCAAQRHRSVVKVCSINYGIRNVQENEFAFWFAELNSWVIATGKTIAEMLLRLRSNRAIPF